MTQAEHRDISRKLRVLNHATESGNVSRTCRYFGISRETFYQWRNAFKRDGERALINFITASSISSLFEKQIVRRCHRFRRVLIVKLLRSMRCVPCLPIQ